ncbi:MAG: hypothetical protein ACKV2O_22330 [Acidimicrobiales bacterium]
MLDRTSTARLWSRRGVIRLLGGATAIGAVGMRWWRSPEDGQSLIDPVGNGANASFGRVEVAGWTSGPRPPATGTSAHGGHAPSPPASTERGHAENTAGANPAEGVWSDLFRINVSLTNASPLPVLVSAGQFRLQVGVDGPTVTPYDVSSALTTLAPRSAGTLALSYLAPPGIDPPTLLFDDVARPAAPAMELHLADHAHHHALVATNTRTPS